jgi:hypothetical protein
MEILGYQVETYQDRLSVCLVSQITRLKAQRKIDEQSLSKKENHQLLRDFVLNTKEDCFISDTMYG